MMKKGYNYFGNVEFSKGGNRASEEMVFASYLQDLLHEVTPFPTPAKFFLKTSVLF